MSATDITFKSYNDKSSAKRGLSRQDKDLAPEDYLSQQNGKWGFALQNGAPLARVGTLSKAVDEALEETAPAADPVTPQPKAIWPGSDKPAPKVDAELDAALSQHHEDGSDVQHDAFSSFANSQLTSRPQPNVEPAKATSNNSRIERNREEQNDVKRPSAGTLCAQVWDIATQLSNGDEVPRTKVAKLSEVVKAAEAKGINKFTARTQYARWRVFHGITGRNV